MFKLVVLLTHGDVGFVSRVWIPGCGLSLIECHGLRSNSIYSESLWSYDDY